VLGFAFPKQTMSWEELHALGPLINAITTDDACLFLWVCPPLVQKTLAMVKAWGSLIIRTVGLSQPASAGAMLKAPSNRS
jgi:hypothetical protein